MLRMTKKMLRMTKKMLRMTKKEKHDRDNTSN